MKMDNNIKNNIDKIAKNLLLNKTCNTCWWELVCPECLDRICKYWRSSPNLKENNERRI